VSTCRHRFGSTNIQYPKVSMRAFLVGLWLTLSATLTEAAGFEGLRPNEGADHSMAPEILAKTPVIVLYAGDVDTRFDSDFSRNLQPLLAALSSPEADADADDLFLARVREFILHDMAMLAGSTDREVAVLRREFCVANPKMKAGLAVFRNGGNTPTPSGQFDWEFFSSWEAFRPDQLPEGADTPAAVRRTWSILNALPLFRTVEWPAQMTNHRLILGRAMEELRLVFPVDRHRFILFLKGRGDAEHVLISQYGFDTSKLDRTKLREAFLAAKKRFVFGNETPEAFVFRGEVTTIVHEVLESLLPRFSPLKGIKKDELVLELFGGGGGRPLEGMYFTKVILLSTYGRFSLSDVYKENVTDGDYRGLDLHSVGRIHHLDAMAQSEFPFRRLLYPGGIKAALRPTDILETRIDHLLSQLQK
jgi:hypothetical protein